MVKIAIVGWYGTETIGDRAILAGIFNILSDVYDEFEINLGSIYPAVTERTIFEDYDFYQKCLNKGSLKIRLFNSSRIKPLCRAIDNSDLILVGGGPLMDTLPMYMLEYAFKYAKKRHKRTVVFGSGMGPLSNCDFIKSAISIVNHSDLVIFRDSKSIELYDKFSSGNPYNKNVFASIDPAVFAAMCFLKSKENVSKKDRITINFREIIADINAGVSSDELEERLVSLVSEVAQSSDVPVRLIPMHTFVSGGDDRHILNQIARKVEYNLIEVQNKPLSLEQTMEEYYNSKFCIGMRFHAILLQTVLTGQNYMLDYTDPKIGKIINLVHQFKAESFYKERYYSLLENVDYIDFCYNSEKQFRLDAQLIKSYRQVYVDNLKNLKL